MNKFLGKFILFFTVESLSLLIGIVIRSQVLNKMYGFYSGGNEFEWIPYVSLIVLPPVLYKLKNIVIK